MKAKSTYIGGVSWEGFSPLCYLVSCSLTIQSGTSKGRLWPSRRSFNHLRRVLQVVAILLFAVLTSLPLWASQDNLLLNFGEGDLPRGEETLSKVIFRAEGKLSISKGNRENPTAIWNKLSSDKLWQALVRQLNAQKYGKRSGSDQAFCYTGVFVSENGEVSDFELFIFDFIRAAGRKKEIASLIYTRVNDCAYSGYVLFSEEVLTSLGSEKKLPEISIDRHLKQTESAGWFAGFQLQLPRESETCVRAIKVCSSRHKPENKVLGFAEILNLYWECEPPGLSEVCHQTNITNSAAKAAIKHCKN